MFRFCTAAALVIAAALFTSTSAHASKVKVWHHHNSAHYDKAAFKGAVISSEGVLRLSRQLRPFAGLDAAHVWDVVEDKNGNLFVATGDDGKLYKVAADGKPSVIYTSRDSQILSMLLAPDGTVYIGTGPSGTIVAVPPEGKAKVFAEDLDQYVWSLVYDPESRNLFAGTGPKGRVFRVTPDGKSSPYYTTRQEHVLCLARDGKGILYAGTDKGGLVYRIDPMGKGFVLYQSGQGEVRSLLVTADSVYAGTASPVKRRPAGVSANGSAVTPTAAATEGAPAAAPP